MTAVLPPDTAERLADVIHEVWDERTSEQMTTCPNHCGCRKQTDDPDAHDCGCSGPCCTDPAWWDGRSDPEAYANALLPTVAQLVAERTAALEASLASDRRRLLDELHMLGVVQDEQVKLADARAEELERAALEQDAEAARVRAGFGSHRAGHECAAEQLRARAAAIRQGGKS